MTSSGGEAGPGLVLDDILDLRAYERVREGFRAEVMARKRRRRVSVGPFVTLVFESVDTVRFQIQEMARVERIATDEGIQAELDVYNRLLPSPGELSATLFVELTSEADLRNWLPRLIGIERSVVLELGSEGEGSGGGGAPLSVRSEPEAEHAASLTRAEVTPAVHYLRFPFTADEVERFGGGTVAVVLDHPEYRGRTELAATTIEALTGDLTGRTEPVPLASPPTASSSGI